jgi:nucleotide-binding universal stress UspA family protein
MSNFRKILVPTDFSSDAEEAFRVACDLALVTGGAVVVCHVSQPPAVVSDGNGAPAIVAGRRSKDVWDELRRIQPKDPAVHVEHEVIVAGGSDAENILRLLEQQKCDLIVMGTHGRTSRVHRLFGGVTDDIVRKAACPVILVKAPADAVAAPIGQDVARQQLRLGA